MFSELYYDEELGELLDRYNATVPTEISQKLGEGAATADLPTLIGEVLSVFNGGRGAVGAFFLFTFGIAALMALVCLAPEKMQRSAECAVSVIAGTLLFSRLASITAEVSETVGGVLSFCGAAIPILSSVIAYGGGVSGAASGLSGANLTLGIIGGVIVPALGSCASLIFALGLVGTGSDVGGTLAKKAKGLFMWLIGLSSTLLLSSIGLQSAIASSSDTAALRAAKYAASGTIPIVGGSVSSAMGTLVAGVGYIKDVIGVGAVTVILMTALSPLAALLLYRLALSVAEGLLEILGVGFGTRIFSSFKAALDALIAVFALTVTVLIIEIVILMKSGVSGI